MERRSTAGQTSDGHASPVPPRRLTDAPTRSPTGATDAARVGPLSAVTGVPQALGNRAFIRHLQRQVTTETGVVGLRARDGLDVGTWDRRPRVQTLQEQLNTRIGTGLVPDGMWGPITTDAVHRAQALAGLPLAEIVDQPLADFLAGGPPATEIRSGAAMLVGLEQGAGLDPDKLDVANRVRLLQTKLGERGAPVSVDGMWGPATDAALRAFQTANGLTPGSPIDADTAEALLGEAQTTTIDPGSSSELVPGVRTETRPFGTYIVLPDGQSALDFPFLVVEAVEVLSETEFAALQALWDELVSGEGTIQIGHIDPDGNNIPGFRDRMLEALGTLLSRPVGRGVIRDIHTAGRMLLIAPDRPMNAPAGQPRASGPETIRDRGRGLAPPVGNGLPSDSTILMPPDLDDETFVILDENGDPHPVPMFEILGHELGHSLHNAQGQNRAGEPGSHPGFPNREEENTDDIENAIRAEHGLEGRRFRHGARRRRPTDFADE